MSPKSSKRSKRPLLPQVLCGLLLSFTVFLFAPIEMYILNGANFWFQLKDFVPFFLLLFAVSFLMIEGVYLLFRKLPYAIYLLLLALLFSITFCIYLQGNYLCLNNDALTAEAPVWKDMLIPMLGNLLIWGSIIVGSIIFILLKPKIFTRIISAVCALVMIMEGSALAVLLINNTQNKELTNIYCSDAEQYTYSQNGDVIVYMIDTYDVRLFNRMLEEDPEYAETFRDFTYYRNASCSYPLTESSFMSFITGINCYNEESFFHYTRRAFEESPFFPKLLENGLTVQIYGAPTGIFSSKQLSQVSNLRNRESSVRSYKAFTTAMMRMVGYRYAPQALQPFLLTEFVDAFTECQLYPYGIEKQSSTNNLKFLQNMKELGITVDNARRFFKFYALNGAHHPFEMDRYAQQVPSGSVDNYEQSLGCTLVLREAFDALKQNGVYDKSTIIVMADHGINSDFRAGICSPIFLVKYPNESNFSEMRVSDAPVQLLDFQATVLCGVGIDYEAFGTPVQLWEGTESRERYLMTYTYRIPSGYDFYLDELTEYAVPANAADLDQYVLTGRTFNAEDSGSSD